MNPNTPNTPPMTWTAAVMPDDALDPESLVGRMLRCDDVPPVEQEITGDGSGASLPPFSNQPRVGDPLPLWRVMHDAYWTEAGVDTSRSFPPPVPECIAAEIDALANYLLPDSDALRINELAAAQQHLRRALRARLTEQARIARGEP